MLKKLGKKETGAIPSKRFRDVNKIPANEVCVLCLGGGLTQTDKQAHGYALLIENEVLKDLDAKVPVYSAVYDFENCDRKLAQQASFIKYRDDVLTPKEKQEKILDKATEEELNPTYITEIFEKTLLPRISLHNGKGRLSKEEACKRIRKLNIVAHCHGGHVALKLEEKMQQALQDLGYTKEEKKLIQSQLLIVAQAPACPLRAFKSQFISFRSACDFVGTANNLFNRYLNKMFDKDDAGQEFNLQPAYSVEFNSFLIKQRYVRNLPRSNEREHYMNFLPTADQNKDGKILAYFARTILINGIKNSLEQDKEFKPLPPVDKLILSGNFQDQLKTKELFKKMKINWKSLRMNAVDYFLQIRKEMISHILQLKKEMNSHR